MGTAGNISGQMFNRLTAVRQLDGRSSSGSIVWLFRCLCGNETMVPSFRVLSGKTKSCGCLQKEKAAKSAEIMRAEKARRAPSLTDRFWSKVNKKSQDECWPWTACVRRKDEGYGAFFYCGTNHPASRVAWILTNGNVGPKTEVCHSCDNPPCCNPRHLFLGTRKDNNDDKVTKKRHAFGERVNTAKLTEHEALEIKRLKLTSLAPAGYREDIARRFGIKRNTVTDIWNRTWKHLD